jgi:hypothetical protein
VHRLATPVAFVLLTAVSRAALAEPTGPSTAATETASEASIELDLTGLEPIDPSVRAELAKSIHAEADKEIAEHGLPAEKIHVRVSWQDQGDVDYAVRIHFDAHEWMPASVHPATTGPDTSSAALTGVISAALARSLGDWDRDYEARRPTESIVPIVEPPPVADSAPRGRRLDKVGWAGVGLAIVGAGALAGGVAAVVIDHTVDPDDAFRLRDWSITGYALIGVGSAAIIAGTLMAVLDARKQRRASPRHARFAPAPMRRGGGVAFSLAF